MFNALVPELAVSDWKASLRFYRDVLGFRVVYQRPEEGLAYLALGEAELMIDQIGLGRAFGLEGTPGGAPFGRGLNLQIRVVSLDLLVAALGREGTALYLPLEERWYRRDGGEVGQRQFIVADPDGYLLRFCEPLTERPLGEA